MLAGVGEVVIHIVGRIIGVRCTELAGEKSLAIHVRICTFTPFVAHCQVPLVEKALIEGAFWSPQYQFKHLAKVKCHLRGDIWHTVVQKYVQ